MLYDLYLFDLDETLFDFSRAEREAFAQTVREIEPAAVLDQWYLSYQRINTRLWQAFEQGRMKKTLIPEERFRQLCAEHRCAADWQAMSSSYLRHLAAMTYLIDGAEELCRKLSQSAMIGIVTNGLVRVQHPRIAQSSIKPFIDFVVVSEECDAPKPNQKFFEYALQKAGCISKARSIIIGDRLETDILGGNTFGIATCWFNPYGAVNQKNIRPTHEVVSLDAITNLTRQ